MLICYIAIKMDDGGPAVYAQERIGRFGRTFKIYKFRSMYRDAEERKKELESQNEMNGFMFKMKDDPRITKVGKVIRKLSIDELPQFFNVLKGDMSLVGPRPERIEHVELYTKEIPEFGYRLKVKGGLTGYAQVNGRNSLSWEEKFEMDVWYVDNISFVTDLKVIFITIKKVLFREDINSATSATMEYFDGTN